jgi:four helix bundle protein
MSYQDLIVYQKAKILTKEIIQLFDMLPKNKTIDIIQNQIVRSVCSIGANIVKGYGRNRPREYKHFLTISRGSCFETSYWLEVLEDLVPDQIKIKISELLLLNTGILKMLTVTIRNLRLTA